MKIMILNFLICFIITYASAEENTVIVYQAESTSSNFVTNAYLGEPHEMDMSLIYGYKIKKIINDEDKKLLLNIEEAYQKSLKKRMDVPHSGKVLDPYDPKYHLIVHDKKNKQYYAINFPHKNRKIFEIVRLNTLFDIFIPFGMFTRSENKNIVMFLESIEFKE